MSRKVTYNANTADVLTDVLGAFRIRGRVFCSTELSAPWSMKLPASAYAHFHVVERGGGRIEVEGAKNSVPLASGDLVIVPHGSGHTLSGGAAKTKPVPLDRLLRTKPPGQHTLRHGGGGEQTNMVCGSFLFENAAAHPLLSQLPPLIHIRGDDGGQMGEWLRPTLRLLAHEARHARQGSGTIVTRLTDVIFVQAIRAWIEEQPAGRGGWLGALRDRQIGAALQLIHKEPERAWSVASLAAAAGMSRSPFAAKFTALVGEPPLTYLTNWRMHLAANLIRGGELTVGEVAVRAGYESEAAFGKAFKRKFGAAPGAFRQKTPGSADQTVAV